MPALLRPGVTGHAPAPGPVLACGRCSAAGRLPRQRRARARAGRAREGPWSRGRPRASVLARLRGGGAGVPPAAGARSRRSRSRSTLWRWIERRRPRHRHRVPAGPPLGDHAAGGHRRRRPDPPVQHRLHEGGRRATRATSRTSTCSSCSCWCWCWARSMPVMFIGWEGRGTLLLPAHRLLVRRPGQRGRRQEGVHHEPDR